MKAAPPSRGSPPSRLPPEASCPVCLELFRDPVSIHCGHTFCRGCIERRWERATDTFPCPRCREPAPERSLRPSRELATLLAIARGLGLGGREEEEEEEEGCGKHREPLRVFCREDEALLCGVCRESRVHRAHTLVSLGEARGEYEAQLQARLQILREDRDRLLEFREAEMRKNWECLEQTERERQRILGHFQGLRVSLEDHARRLLARLRRLETELEKEQEENLTSLTQEISRLESRIRELEEKRREPTRTFLQDIGSTLSRFPNEHSQLPPSPLPRLEKKIGKFREKNLVLEETLRSFQDILMFELPEKIVVTLDPSTAHPQLLVAPDGRSVSWEPPRDSGSPDPGPDPSVRGHPGVASGLCCWDVEVSPRGSWALGVAPESPPGELWSMGLCQGQLWALTALERVPLARVRVPRRVRVSLDHDGGRVAFLDAERRALIFAFPAAAFGGRRVHPWFLVWGEGARIALCP
ncbi:E3 ubiquitin-protein ligase TRIM7-like [Manacus candei]|uniref:E3 ubiquitin-protein ligase TRIM7-like n=1 Tax=Manacus candei TaxID=415023 RepID=UPI0022260E4F|nr:E3 ubiquitin-protein ligase TRIM7-like [Manacus candei]